MDRRKELVEQYKELKTEAGIYKIENTRNGKLFVASTNNFKSMNRMRMMLGLGSHPNRALQLEWTQYGGDAFTFEVLEVLKKKDSAYFDTKKELKKLEDQWLDRLQPFKERGYNTPAPARE
ncbi:GIY-YIG nuclease family protein [Paenibacillus hodogayensis]|uniref:GIY-YIG nuclease family protein n=1 Tax=Paenibacillus hodogayensis TaxID=279208 RepID=A0ABV5W789_9BACL